MTEGFLLDETYGARHPVRWVEGAPERSAWTGTKVRGRTVYTVQVYRCEVCGALRSYALRRKR